jgi:hypothetical protein
VSGKIKIFLEQLPRIRGYEERNNFAKILPLFSLFVQICQNSAAELSGHSTFYSALFDLYGKTISRLATLKMSQNVWTRGGGGGRGLARQSLEYLTPLIIFKYSCTMYIVINIYVLGPSFNLLLAYFF